MHKGTTHPAATFAQDGYQVVRSLLDEATCASVLEHLVKLARVGILRRPDEQVPGSPAMYGEPVVEEMLEELKPVVESITGVSLLPTYSYVRLYKPGASLARHQDRDACEISLTLSLGAAPAWQWPIWIEGFRKTEAVCLAPGDALVYRAIECAHWRDAFTGEFAAQAFLHYVDQHGRYTDWKFDKRQALNT